MSYDEDGGGSFKHYNRRGSNSSIAYNTDSAEYLSWRRLHLSKSKLSGVAEMASFMAGFAVVATVELQINASESDCLLTAFVVVTSILVATSMMVIMISTCILPQLEAVTKMSKCPSDEVTRSPHDSLIRFIDFSWILANTVSLFLFTLDVILVCWIKFRHHYPAAPWAATAIMVPVLLIILIFGIVFYRKIIKHQYNIASKKFMELEEMQHTLQSQLDDMTRTGTPNDSEFGGGLPETYSMSPEMHHHFDKRSAIMDYGHMQHSDSDIAGGNGGSEPFTPQQTSSPSKSGGGVADVEGPSKVSPSNKSSHTYTVYDV